MLGIRVVWANRIITAVVRSFLSTKYRYKTVLDTPISAAISSMLTLEPRWRIASRVPSTSSFRRSTLCWCQRRLRPSVLTAAGGVCCATIALVRSLGVLDTTANARREARRHDQDLGS